MNPFTTTPRALLAPTTNNLATLVALLDISTAALVRSGNERMKLIDDLATVKADAETAVFDLETEINALETELDDAAAKIADLETQNAAMKAVLVKILDAVHADKVPYDIGCIARKEVIGLLRLAVNTYTDLAI